MILELVDQFFQNYLNRTSIYFGIPQYYNNTFKSWENPSWKLEKEGAASDHLLSRCFMKLRVRALGLSTT